MDKHRKERQEVIGRNLRQCRINAHLTQYQVAQRAGISHSYYANLERGNRTMSIWVLRSLADALNVSTDYLLYEESQRTHIENICHLLQNKPILLLTAVERATVLLEKHAFRVDAAEASRSSGAGFSKEMQ